MYIYGVYMVFLAGSFYSMCRVGQNHIYIYIYTVYMQYFWQGPHQIYGHIRCIHTILANPKHVVCPPYLLQHVHALLHAVMMQL
jgi:hypothetical protein